MTRDAALPTAWLPPPDAALALGPGDVHVWRASLRPSPGELAALAVTLAADERDRAARFHFERDRTAFTAARGTLRLLVGRYLARSPDEVGFGYRDKGKPYLVHPAQAARAALRFNVSHSGDLALLAFVRDREIGVDIEARRPVTDLAALAAVSFSPAEHATLLGLPTADQPRAFFACWARKEAFIKATGEGVSQLAEFDVSLRPGEPARLLRVAGDAATRRWSMHDLPEVPGYATALVVEQPAGPDGDAPRVVCWDAASLHAQPGPPS
jgi:4'-phosphopantetheinyl transferase